MHGAVQRCAEVQTVQLKQAIFLDNPLNKLTLLLNRDRLYEISGLIT